MGFRAAAVALAAAAVLGLPASSARASASGDAKEIRRGIDVALARGWIKPEDADAYRAELKRALADVSFLPRARSRELAGVLHDLARLSDGYLSPRARTLFGELAANDSWLEAHGVPSSKTDVTDADGVVYRAFPGHGLQFHPLGAFSALEVMVDLKQTAEAERLAQALVARAIPKGDGLVWEYLWPYSGARPPWTSGMAQAVAAQILARTSVLTGDVTLLDVARRAYAAIPGRLILQLPSGPWIRHYSFARLVVLNSQLQSTASILEYAKLSGDTAAADLGAQLAETTKALLPRFDTGAWTLYSLGGYEESLEYHRYVVTLLWQLGSLTGDPFWGKTALRFKGYTTTPPAITPGAAPGTLYPRPADGYRDYARIRFWLSKASTVTLTVAGRNRRIYLSRGPHVLWWWPGTSLQPGSYDASLHAVDLAGNATDVALPPVTVAWDTRPPAVDASLSGSVLTWRAADEGTPWLDLRVVLSGARTRVLRLGRNANTGSLRLRLPAGRWSASLVAANSAGRRTTVPLGRIG